MSCIVLGEFIAHILKWTSDLMCVFFFQNSLIIILYSIPMDSDLCLIFLSEIATKSDFIQSNLDLIWKWYVPLSIQRVKYNFFHCLVANKRCLWGQSSYRESTTRLPLPLLWLFLHALAYVYHVHIHHQFGLVSQWGLKALEFIVLSIIIFILGMV